MDLACAAERRLDSRSHVFAGHDPWYVVQTKSRSEAKVMRHLERQGFEAYLPRCLEHRRVVPLFPRYLFVTVDMATQRWRAIKSTIGVSRLVCNGDEPAPVPPAVMADLQGREDADGFIKLDDRHPRDERLPRFAPGERVRVVDGPFADRLGLFEGMADRERVAILLDLLGRKARVLLLQGAITAA